MTSEELWDEIEEFPRYSVSNYGRVQNLQTGLVLKPRYNGRGYLIVGLTKDGCLKNRYIHRLVALVFVSGWFIGAEINHLDGDKDNNYFENLQWSTRTENIQHAIDLGLLVPSRRDKQIRCVETNEVFMSLTDAANCFNIQISNISAHIHGRLKSVGGYHFELVDL